MKSVRCLRVPYRTYGIITLTLLGLGVAFIKPEFGVVLWGAAVLGSLDTFWDSAKALVKRRVTIDTFNIFALIVSFATGNVRSAGRLDRKFLRF